METLIKNLKRTFSRLKKQNTFISNISVLMIGIVIAQALGILISPVLTRLYDPADFGVYSLYTSILSVLTVFASMRFETALALPEDDKESSNIFILSFIIIILVTLITVLIVLTYRFDIASLLNTESLESWLWLMPLSVLIAGSFRVFNYWSVREKKFNRLSGQKIVSSVTTVTTQTTVGSIASTFNGGLIAGSVLGQFVSTFILGVQIFISDGKEILKDYSTKIIIEVFSRFSKFTFYSTLSDTLNIVSTLLPFFVLAYFFDSEVVGYYSLGYRILSLPTIIIGGAVAQVLLPKAIEHYRSDSLNIVIFDVFKKLFNAVWTPLLLITIVAPQLFEIVFGEGWDISGRFVQYLSPWLLTVFLSSTLSIVYIVRENQKPNFYINVLMIIFRLAVLVYAGINKDVTLSIVLYGIIGFVFSFINLLIIIRMSYNNINEFLSFMVNHIVKSTVYLLPIILMVSFSSKSVIIVVSAIFSGLCFLTVQTLKLYKMYIAK